MNHKQKYRQRTNRPQLEEGFTLIELLIAMLILTIGMLGITSLTSGIIRGNFYSKNITSATAIAQTTLEGAQRVGYSGVDDFVASTVPAHPSMGGVTFTQSASVATASNLKTVSVTVSWSEINNASRSVNLQTILAQ